MHDSTFSPLGIGRIGTRCLAVVAGLGVFLVASFAFAQPPRAARQGHKKDRFQKLVFAPELVMAHQGEIGLQPDQKQALIGELQRTQTDLVPLQFEMREASELLARLLEPPRVDEGEALAAAERVMGLEAEIKKLHLALVIRIKNLLTEEQQAELRRLRGESRWGSLPGHGRG